MIFDLGEGGGVREIERARVIERDRKSVREREREKERECQITKCNVLSASLNKTIPSFDE